MATLAQRLQAEIDRANETTSKTDTTVHNAIGSLIEGYGQGGIEQVTWHQCPEAVRNYLDNVTYDPSDYTTSQIADYAPATAVVANTKPIGKTVDGITYYNEVPNVETPFSSANVAGTVKPLDRLRWLNTSTTNVRDLGGWNCDGGTVKYGMLLRGGLPNSADTELIVNQMGIRHQLDLQGNESIGYSTWGIEFSRFDSYHWYSIADKSLWKKELSVVFDCITHHIPLYFHCYSGADRTGTLACILEALLGMSQSDIDKDYELTNFYIRQDATMPRMRNSSSWVGLINAIKSVSLEGGLTDTFRNRAVSFVLSLGFTIDEINAFRRAMIDGNPSDITVLMDTFSVSKSGANVTFDNNIASVDEFQGYKVNLSANSGYVISNVTVSMGGNTISAFDGEKVKLYRKVTNVLSHCTTNNRNNSCIDEQGYGAIITADRGYTLDGGAISIKVGGVEMAQQYYSNGAITIPNVTGNVVINVTAVEQGPTYANLADSTSPDWLTDKRISSSGAIGDSNGAIVTNFIPCTEGDVIRVKYLNMNTNLPDTNSSRIGFYDSSKTYLSQSKLEAYSQKMTDEGNGVFAITLNGLASAFSYIRINNSITSGQVASDVIITVNEEIN